MTVETRRQPSASGSLRTDGGIGAGGAARRGGGKARGQCPVGSARVAPVRRARGGEERAHAGRRPPAAAFLLGSRSGGLFFHVVFYLSQSTHTHTPLRTARPTAGLHENVCILKRRRPHKAARLALANAIPAPSERVLRRSCRPSPPGISAAAASSSRASAARHRRRSGGGECGTLVCTLPLRPTSTLPTSGGDLSSIVSRVVRNDPTIFCSHRSGLN